eukprot:c44347_g1_i1 orf=1-204(-)
MHWLAPKFKENQSTMDSLMHILTIKRKTAHKLTKSESITHIQEVKYQLFKQTNTHTSGTPSIPSIPKH